jgi:EAL domain-containing protein (putative c-di-GMP-specific phosphodiesterase class I)/CheY-like chemotaxis protein
MSAGTLTHQSVLVIDDEPLMRKLIIGVLKGMGIKSLQGVASGSDALAMLAGGDSCIDIILCDLQMPEMDGIEVIRHLADVGYDGALVLVSAEDQRILQTAESFAQVRGLNVLGSVSKPITPAALAAVIQRYRPAESSAAGYSMPAVSAEELQQAMTTGQLQTWFQPKVDVRTRRVKGVETLARWFHPDKGMIPPGIFVELAERHQLIDPLTDVIIEQAVRQGGRWQQRGLDLNLAVNVSMDNVQRLDFPDRLVAMAAEAGLPLSKLTLEVTESRLVQDLGTCLEVLTRLRLKGLDLSIDDFGTGYASLEHLQRIPFVELKVDRAFVHGARDSRTARAILETSIGLARQLNMRVVAEGVEDQQGWDIIERLGTDLVQGYFIAAPMTADAFEDWLNDPANGWTM